VAPTGPGTWKPGVCEGTEGVTVVVDWTLDLGDQQLVRCALGVPANGVAALRAIGLAVNANAPDAVPGSVCTIEYLPLDGYPSCWLIDGYWSYWRAPSTAGTWDFAPTGPSQGPLVAGTVEGFAWAPGFESEGPRTGPDGNPIP
jgi:hypothetical protein